MRNAWIVILLAAASACRPAPPKPVDIEAYDMCAFCRMAISQKQFAAEIIDNSGSAQKFDDIGCMLRYRNRQTGAPPATFVADYRSREWLNAGSAFFIRSDRLKTPMGGGLVAFRDAQDAESAAREFDSPVLRLSELETEKGGRK